MVKIRLNENKLNKLFEYRNEPRLPFDDEYGKKNQAEHYLDWLEEFGRYDNIDGSKLSLQDCVESGVRDAINANRISYNYYETCDTRDEMIESSIEEISNDLMSKFKYIINDDRGNIYIERAIKIADNIDSVVNDLFLSLSDRYGGNVGGCWSFRKGGGIAYCASKDKNSLLLLRGWIRLEDIDWLKTCDLNYHQDEYEIRVKPNARVELFEVIANGSYKLPLKGNLVVSSTYFGNNKGYEGDLVTIDDGMGHSRLFNRDGNYIDYGQVRSLKYLGDGKYLVHNLYGKCTIINKDGEQLINTFYDDIDYMSNGFIVVTNGNFYNFIDENGNLLSDKWFSNVLYLNDEFCEVEISDKYNLFGHDGLLYNEWFNWIDEQHDGIIRVERNDTMISYLRSDGSFLTNDWFDNGSHFSGNVAIVKIEDDDWNVKSNFLGNDGKIKYPEKWFDRISLGHLGDYDKEYKVKLDDKMYFANADGIVDFEHPYPI